jgi:hypothetical protein
VDAPPGQRQRLLRGFGGSKVRLNSR